MGPDADDANLETKEANEADLIDQHTPIESADPEVLDEEGSLPELGEDYPHTADSSLEPGSP